MVIAEIRAATTGRVGLSYGRITERPTLRLIPVRRDEITRVLAALNFTPKTRLLGGHTHRPSNHRWIYIARIPRSWSILTRWTFRTIASAGCSEIYTVYTHTPRVRLIVGRRQYEPTSELHWSVWGWSTDATLCNLNGKIVCVRPRKIDFFDGKSGVSGWKKPVPIPPRYIYTVNNNNTCTCSVYHTQVCVISGLSPDDDGELIASAPRAVVISKDDNTTCIRDSYL